MKKITELGCPGHLIVAGSCRWRRHTQVGKYRISTLGNYYVNGKKDTIGSGKDEFFESMVFKTTGKPDKGNEGCGCQAVVSYESLECFRYSNAGDAQKGHERLIKKYAK